jgi:precorrin-2 dehydrogenase / sirohydrochlorin ferrochelatase
LCDFFVPAVVRRGNLQIAIGTDGYCPAYSGHLRKKLEAIITEQHGQFLAELEWARKKILEDISDPADRKALMGEVVDDESFGYFTANGSVAWREKTENRIRSHQSIG